MKRSMSTRTLLSGALAAALAFGASAQSDGDAAKEKELEAAREQLQQAARRVAELSRELGRPGDGAFVFEHRFLTRPVLGVLLDEDDGSGVRVSGVTPASGAATAGLRAGDRIVSIDGKAVAGTTGAQRVEGLRAMLADLKEGAAVRVGYERDGKASVASVTPRQAAPLTLHGEDGSSRTPRGDVRIFRRPGGGLEVEAREVHVVPRPGERLEIQHGDMPGTPGTPRIIERRVIRGDGKPGDAPRVAVFDMASGVSPDVHREVIRIGRDGACKDGSDCRTLALSEAFRWNGLNLASVDEQLGRYFGTRDGVLVVSAGPDLAGLQSGDVIRKVDGKAVSSPRDVMDVLRTKPEGETVAIDYLRDRAPGSARIKAPKAMRIPLPPMPRAAPAAPVPPAPSGRPAAAPTPPSPAGIARLAPPRPPVHAMAPVFPAPPAPPHFRRVD